MVNGAGNNREILDDQKRYEIGVRLYLEEFRILSNKTNAFLIVQSIFGAAFILLVVNAQNLMELKIIALVVALLGLLFCVMHYVSGRLGSEASFVWRNYILIIERRSKGKGSKDMPFNWFDKHPSYHGKNMLDKLLWPVAWLFTPILFFLIWQAALLLVVWNIRMPISIACISTSLIVLLVLLPIYSVCDWLKHPPTIEKK